MSRVVAVVPLVSILLLAIGCAPTQKLGVWTGPTAPAVVTVEKLPYAGGTGTLVRTQHYKIYTTIDDRADLIDRMGQLMEGAFQAYCQLAPGVPQTTQPMDCYLFAKRQQWAEFTVQHTGIDAPTYLHIMRGGYTIHDWYVAYFIGDVGTYSVAAHEGWHQFVARHFKGRLPPFLEEGIACMFENVDWEGDLPRFNLSINQSRALSLRKAVEQKQLWPLQELVTLHAGQVVGLSGTKVEAFYAQNWAFAKFLWEGEGAKYRPAFQKMLADTAAGTVEDPTGSLRRKYLPWQPAGVKPMLEHYLGTDLAKLDVEYEEYLKHIAYDEMRAQFDMSG